jgi:general secretion pathway protein E/type IV pilus assembly protein PilB
LLGPDVDVKSHWRAVGCERCYFTGYKGRKAIYEVIPMDTELSDAIRTGRDDISGLLGERGIVTLRQSALKLFADGATSLEELIPQMQ